MSNKPLLHRAGRDRAVQHLIAERAATGELTALDFQFAARSCGYSTRQLKRVLARHDAAAGTHSDPDQTTSAFLVDEDVTEMVFRTCGNLANAHARLSRAGHPVPSLSTFKRKVKDQMGSKQLALAKGGPRRARISKTYLKRNPEQRGYTYLLDHTELPIYVVPDRHSTAVRPWMTAVMDAETGYLLSWLITFGTPTAEEVRASLIAAFTPRLAEDDTTVVGGLPERCLWDRGLDFLSDLVTGSCERLDVQGRALAAYSPHLKGRLERFWGFVKDNGLAPLPGYFDKGHDLAGNAQHAKKALSEQAFLLELDRWVSWRNSQHVSRTLGCTALQAWQSDPTPLRTVPADQLWQDFLLSKDNVKVGNAGVRFKRIDYVSLGGELDHVFGRSVQVRYLPHQRNFIEVFLGGEHVATCYPADALRADDKIAFLEARRRSDAEARKHFQASNRLRDEHPDAVAIHKEAGRGKKTRMVVDVPEIDLYQGAEEALRKLKNPTMPGQLRMM